MSTGAVLPRKNRIRPPTLSVSSHVVEKEKSSPCELLKVSPQTTRVVPSGKSYENMLHKPKIINSHSSKKISTKNINNSGSKDQILKPAKKNSDPSLKKLPDSAFKDPNTPRNGGKVCKNSPRALSKPKKNLIVLSKSKKTEPKKPVDKLLSQISFMSATGSVGGKQKMNNQDCHVIVQNYASKSQTLLGVMDGHGIYGHDVSLFVKKQLPLLIENNLPYEVTNSTDCSPEILLKIKKALSLGFINTHKTLVNKRVIDINYSGTTANIVLIRNKTCICANVGDSRAIIGRFNEI